MRIGLITTLNTNIGDDLIREGIVNVLTDIYKDQKIDFIPVNKHKPYTVYPRWHPISLAPRGKRTLSRLLYKFGESRFDDCDLVVQCGAPVFWHNCYRNEWAEPIWYQIIRRIHDRIPIFNLAAGSCYPWESQPQNVDNEEDARYIKNILSFCRLTTVRDELAQRLCASLGSDLPFIPCSAFLSAPIRSGEKKQDQEYILINYMRGGGHYEWEQAIDAENWEETMRKLVARLGKRRRIAFICHNEKEYQLAGELEPSAHRFFPKTPGEYFQAVSGAVAGVCNRLHASVALAGVGSPSVSVGTDTRLLMPQALNMPCFYVKDVSADLLEYELERLISSATKEKERLMALRTKTFNEYRRLITGLM